ncbi:MAG: HAD family hydrolase [Clostridia bacterium]|nr:HAD family hydrolase [Clostridia bacterium]
MKIEGAIFDLDGTLIDSMVMWDTLASTYLLETHGIVADPSVDDTINELNGVGACKLIREWFNLEETEEEIEETYCKIIRRFYCERVQLKPGVETMLKHLKDKGVKICIVTATARNLMEPALERLGIGHYVSAVFGGADKSKPDAYERALAFLNTPKENTVIFEDALYAIETAKAAGYPVVAVYENSFRKDADRIRTLADVYVDTMDQALTDIE